MNNHLTTKTRQSYNICVQFIKAILGKVWHLHSKNKMFGLHNWVIPFFLIYPCMLCHFILKRKIFKEHVKQKKKNQNTFKYSCKHVFRRCESIWCTLKVIVPIKQLWLCINVFDYLISLFSYDETLMFLAKVSHTTRILFANLDTVVQVQCDLAI